MDPLTDLEEEDVTERRRLGDSRWWLAIATTIFFALWGWREVSMRAAREHIASRDAEIRALTGQQQMLEQKNEKLNGAVATLAAAERTISLIGQRASPNASARVFLEPSKHRAIAVFANLPGNPSDKSYQLWIIRADPAKPQGVGIFDASSNGTAMISVDNLPADTEIKGIAVTLERKGGVTQPSNTNYYVMSGPTTR